MTSKSQPQSSGSAHVNLGAPSMQLQAHDQMLDAIRSRTAGSIVIQVLGTPSVAEFGPFPAPAFILLKSR